MKIRGDTAKTLDPDSIEELRLAIKETAEALEPLPETAIEGSREHRQYQTAEFVADRLEEILKWDNPKLSGSDFDRIVMYSMGQVSPIPETLGDDRSEKNEDLREALQLGRKYNELFMAAALERGHGAAIL